VLKLVTLKFDIVGLLFPGFLSRFPSLFFLGRAHACDLFSSRFGVHSSAGGKEKALPNIVARIILFVALLLLCVGSPFYGLSVRNAVAAATALQPEVGIEENLCSNSVLIKVASGPAVEERLTSSIGTLAGEMGLDVRACRSIVKWKEKVQVPRGFYGNGVSDSRHAIYRIEFSSRSRRGSELKGRLSELVNRLKKIEWVEDAEVERLYRVQDRGRAEGGSLPGTFSVGLSSLPWWLRVVGAEDAWKATRGDSTVIVAIIDTGCDMDHEALAGAIWRNGAELSGEEGKDDDGNGYVDDVFGWDFVTAGSYILAEDEDGAPQDNDPVDLYGHGTHVAGIVASGEASAPGLAPDCRIMVLRAGFKARDGTAVFLEGDVIEALGYAADMGADVINLSFGGSEADLLHEAIVDAVGRGSIVVAAAGNFGTEEPVYPACYDEVLGVAAADSCGGVAPFSSRGDWVGCSAPGVSILSAVPGGFAAKSGSSQAAAFVSATAALVKSLHPDWTGEVIKVQILNTAGGVDDACRSGVPEFGPPLCRADMALACEPEPLVEYRGSDFDVHLSSEGLAVELKSRIQNVWKGLSDVSVKLAVSGDELICSGDSVVCLSDVAPGEVIGAVFTLEARKFDGEPRLEAPFEITVKADGRAFSFRDSVIINIKGGTHVLRCEVIEESGNGNGAIDASERGRVELWLGNSSDLPEEVSVEPLSPGWPFDGVRVEPGLLSLAPGDTVPFFISFSTVDDREVCGRYPLRISITARSGVEVYEVPVWISFRGEVDLEEDISYQGSSGHTGMFAGSSTGPWKVAWKRVFEGRGNIVSQPVVAGDLCFVLRSESGCNRVYALDGGTGETVWGRGLGESGGFGVAPISFSKGVLCISEGDALFALYYATGEVIWSVDPGKLGLEGVLRFGAPSTYRGRVYFTAQSLDQSGIGYLIACDLYTGEVKWVRNLGKDVYIPPLPPACENGVISIVKAEGGVVSFGEDSSVLWSFDSGESPATALLSLGGRVIFIGREGGVVGLHADSGDVAFRTGFGMRPSGPPCIVEAADDEGVGERGLVLPVRSNDALSLEVLSIENGVRLASCRVPFEFSTGVAACGRTVFIAGESGELATLKYGSQGGWSENPKVYKGVDEMGTLEDDGRRFVPGTPFIAGDRAYVTYHGVEGDELICFVVYSSTIPPGTFLVNSPNPFNPVTTISFSLDRESDVTLGIFDVTGRLIREFSLKGCKAGVNEVLWDGKNSRGEPVAAGVYFCSMKADGVRLARKMVLIR